MKVLALSALTVIMGSTFTSCQDDIAEENRFTFTGELIADHLQKHPEKYSNFCTILKQAKIGKKAGSMLTTLSTYGSYTCFAPTNEAIEKYLLEKSNEYNESVAQNKENPEIAIKNTGITSPRLEDLSDSMATVIAKNHIIEQGITTVEIGSDGSFPKKTMNRRSVSLGWTTDQLGYTVATIEGVEVLEQNIETENGYIHCINGTLSPSDQPTSTLLASQAGFTIFSDALKETGLDEYLTKYEIDPDYDGLGQYGPAFKTQNNQEPPYPEVYNQGFTLLAEPDALLANPDNNHFKIAISNVDDLEYLAAHYYGIDFDKKNHSWKYKGERTNEQNPLYKFIAYHIIDRKMLYKSGKGPGGFLMEGYQTISEGEVAKGEFDSEENLGADFNFDRYDYFETAFPFTSIKVTKPFSNSDSYTSFDGTTANRRDQLVVNYAQEMGTRIVNDATKEKPMEKHINVVIENESTTRNRPGLEDFQPQAVNGMIYTINKILIYNETEMTGNILDERMRWDVFSLFPELTNNDVRWFPIANGYTLTYIPENYCSRLRHNNTDTNIYYLRPYNAGLGTSGGGYANYQGDEMLVTGKYDFQYRIPYVPAGTYEIRFGFSTSDARGVAQFYFGEEGKLEICGIPLDMRNSNQEFMGWFEENEENEDENRKDDKAMRNRGFMKAPASIFGDGGGSLGVKNMRYANSAFRRIIGTYDIEYGLNYWLRFKDVTEGGTDDKPNEFNQDYLEIVPDKVLKNPSKPEDIY